VIDALPSQWIDAAAQMILRRLVCQIAIAERLEVCVSWPRWRMALKRLKPNSRWLACIGRREDGRAWADGLGATPRSRMAAREGRSRFEQGPGAFRPWEIVAKKPDGQAS
jgi:hypothetical protein